ncbi:hypothetical protein PsYK624_081910 [Phanerochaete sordida]|uniref:Uncharacterized protein n=1 Tax=Phanerochaete sordida TaxID=48140 RepID=A0A9P3LEZ0_9APHY|nr:hypothetical protein PsYK624_081910 [Phanerochaete sordida]
MSHPSDRRNPDRPSRKGKERDNGRRDNDRRDNDRREHGGSPARSVASKRHRPDDDDDDARSRASSRHVPGAWTADPLLGVRHPEGCRVCDDYAWHRFRASAEPDYRAACEADMAARQPAAGLHDQLAAAHARIRFLEEDTAACDDHERDLDRASARIERLEDDRRRLEDDYRALQAEHRRLEQVLRRTREDLDEARRAARTRRSPPPHQVASPPRAGPSSSGRGLLGRIQSPPLTRDWVDSGPRSRSPTPGAATSPRRAAAGRSTNHQSLASRLGPATPTRPTATDGDGDVAMHGDSPPAAHPAFCGCDDCGSEPDDEPEPDSSDESVVSATASLDTAIQHHRRRMKRYRLRHRTETNNKRPADRDVESADYWLRRDRYHEARLAELAEFQHGLKPAPAWWLSPSRQPPPGPQRTAPRAIPAGSSRGGRAAQPENLAAPTARSSTNVPVPPAQPTYAPLPDPNAFPDSLRFLRRSNEVVGEPTSLDDLRYPTTLHELRHLMAVAQRPDHDLALRHLGQLRRSANTSTDAVSIALRLELRKYDWRRPEWAVAKDRQRTRERALARLRARTEATPAVSSPPEDTERDANGTPATANTDVPGPVPPNLHTAEADQPAAEAVPPNHHTQTPVCTPENAVAVTDWLRENAFQLPGTWDFSRDDEEISQAIVTGLLTLNSLIGGPTDAAGFSNVTWSLAEAICFAHSGEYIEQIPRELPTLDRTTDDTLRQSVSRVAHALFNARPVMPSRPIDARVVALNTWLSQLLLEGVDNDIRVADEARLASTSASDPDQMDDVEGPASSS